MIVIIILISIGIVGIIGTIWISSSKIRSAEYPTKPGQEWFRISLEQLEGAASAKIREHARTFLKVLLVWMLGIYRKISKRITIKQVMKQKVRQYLYEHTPNSIRHPSEFWHKVRHTGPTTPVLVEEAIIEEIEIKEE